MRLRSGLPIALAVVSGVAALVAAAPAAQAAGDTARYKGCAAHWRNTATWSECQNSPGAHLQLQAECRAAAGYKGRWYQVSGDINPVDRYECTWKALNAFNAYRD